MCYFEDNKCLVNKNHETFIIMIFEILSFANWLMYFMQMDKNLFTLIFCVNWGFCLKN